jgi:hypothetical protein
MHRPSMVCRYAKKSAGNCGAVVGAAVVLMLMLIAERRLVTA